MNQSSSGLKSDNIPTISLWLLALIMGTGFLGITIISPALGTITSYFETSEEEAQLLLSGFFSIYGYFSANLWTSFRYFW